MKTFFTLLALSIVTTATHASTSTEYETACKYVDPQKKLKFSGKCAANFGVVGSTGRAVQYVITYPTGEVTFLISGSEVSANNAPAKSVKNGKKSVHIVTKTGEEYFFSPPSPDDM